MKYHQQLAAGSPANFSVIWQIFCVSIEDYEKRTVDDAILRHEYSRCLSQLFLKRAPVFLFRHARFLGVSCSGSCECCYRVFRHTFHRATFNIRSRNNSSDTVHASFKWKFFFFLIICLSYVFSLHGNAFQSSSAKISYNREYIQYDV